MLWIVLFITLRPLHVPLLFCSILVGHRFFTILGLYWGFLSTSLLYALFFFLFFLLYPSGKFGTLLSLVMVRDCKMQILQSKTSPLPSSCSQWISRATYILPSVSALYSYFMPWTFFCHALLTWPGMLVNTFACLDYRFIVPVCISSLAFAGWVCHQASLANADQDYSHIFWTFPYLDQFRSSSYY